MGKNKKNRNKEKKQRKAVHSLVRYQAIKLWLERVLIMKPEIWRTAKDNMHFYKMLRDEWLEDIQPAAQELFAQWKEAAIKEQKEKEKGGEKNE